MNKVRIVLILLIIGAGLLFGLYVGFFFCFIGGIVQVINEIKSPNINSLILALGVIRILFSYIVGWISTLFIIIPGLKMLCK